MPALVRPLYSVMLDSGLGEFLWVAYRSEDGLVGANVFSLMDTPEEQNLLSEALFHRFLRWAARYMAAHPKDPIDRCSIDWQSFNAEGMQLARLLKAELGSTADVQYVRASDDPGGHDRVALALVDRLC